MSHGGDGVDATSERSAEQALLQGRGSERETHHPATCRPPRRLRHGALALLLGMTAATTGVSTHAADEPVEDESRPVSFELGAGMQYDSNVAVLDLDTSTNAGDAAGLLEIGMGYERPRSGLVGVQAGYNFSQTLHEDFDAFNVGIHRASGNLSFDLDTLDTGAMLQYAHASLDGDEFLVLSQFSPYVSKLVGRKLFLRFAYTRSGKEFATNPGRDADADSASADAYVFLNGLETYVVFGLRYDQEDALDDQFDYAGPRLRAQLSRRIPLGTRELTLKAQLRYEARDYDRPTASIGELREDSRYQLEVTGELPIGDRLLTTVGLRHADNRSNLPAVDFDENVLSVGLRAGF